MLLDVITFNWKFQYDNYVFFLDESVYKHVFPQEVGKAGKSRKAIKFQLLADLS